MKKTFVLFLSVLILFSFSCKKEDTLKLEWNTIIIDNVTSTYLNAGDCSTSGGSEGTNLTFTLEFQNPDDLSIVDIEFDVLYPNGNAFYSFKNPNFSYSANDIVIERCRITTSDAWLDYRFFIITEDGLRSQPFTFRQNKPE